MHLTGALCLIGMGLRCERTRLAKALIVAAPHSGSGKTLVTLGLIRALRNAGHRVASAKVGPDYIDPQFHSAASGEPCVNVDPWAMGTSACASLLQNEAEITIIEGVMGLFDGPEGAKGSTADLAADLGLPVLLVIDCARQAQSIAALVYGFKQHRPDVHIAGLFLNCVKSDRHVTILRAALSECGIPIIGQLRHNDSFCMPSRHLGLVQAMENQSLEQFLGTVASGVARETFLDKLFQIAKPLTNQVGKPENLLPPLAQNIAIASDEAFSFVYPHFLKAWAKAGASMRFFSPLANEAPPKSDAVYLPGGYPELHAGKLAANSTFLSGLRDFKGLIYGECGGYMTLGESLTDAEGIQHTMAALLPLKTSFATRKLHLGYRQLTSLSGPFPKHLRGHEFHYATIVSEGEADRLFEAQTANGIALPAMGLRRGIVMGSFAHIISATP
jgi:cobyrinic acid a,c-diamide synthase